MPPAVRVRSWLRCVAAAALFFAGPAHAAIEVIGSHGYTYNVTAGTVTLNAASIQNTGAATVGPIRLDLWFAASPYTGSTITGWRAGMLPVTGSDGTLATGKTFIGVSGTVALGSKPPTGTYYAILIISRYSEACTAADKYCSNSYLNISPAVSIPASGSVSGSGNTLANDYAASTSTTGTVAVGGSRTGIIEAAGDVDWLSVSLTAGATYQIDVRGAASNGGTLTDPFLALRNANGALLVDDDDSGTGLDSQLTYTPTASGTYYIAASAYSTSTGTYTVAVTSTAGASTLLRSEAIFSTAQSSAQSFLRFYNSSVTAGTVTATLYDNVTGLSRGQWTSPSIPAGAELQYDIATVEAGAGVSVRCLH